MLTVPITATVCVAMGATVAVAGRVSLAEQRLWKSSAFWSLVFLQGLVVVPLGTLLLWRFPAWSLMYAMPSGLLGVADAALAAIYPVMALGTLLGMRRLLQKAPVWLSWGVCAATLVATGLVIWLGWGRLWRVGTLDAFDSAPATLRPLGDSELAFLLPPMLVALLLAWGATLWRLVLFGLAKRAKPIEVTTGQLVATPSKSAAKRGTRRSLPTGKRPISRG